jgi:hypothetical protein
VRRGGDAGVVREDQPRSTQSTQRNTENSGAFRNPAIEEDPIGTSETPSTDATVVVRSYTLELPLLSVFLCVLGVESFVLKA